MQSVTTENAPLPGGHYSQAIIHNRFVFVSGQLPVEARTGEKKTGPIEEQTLQALQNLKAIVEASGSSLDKVVKVTLFIADISLWGKVNEIYAAFFGDHRPARAIVPTQPLHYGFLIEIEAVAAAVKVIRNFVSLKTIDHDIQRSYPPHDYTIWRKRPGGTTTPMASNVDRWASAGLGGMLVMGSNSEAIFLSEEEKLDLIKVTVEHTPEGFPELAGTGLESTMQTIDLTNKAARRGAVAALILTPHFYRSGMNDAALIRHFTTVADESEIPVLIYNVPKYTGINVSRQVCCRTE